MPIVFVHGVNNRLEDDDYESGVKIKTEFIKSIFAQNIGISVQQLSVSFPYWGGEGVKFRWNQASVPLSTDDDKTEYLSINKPLKIFDRPELWEAEARFQYGKDGINLIQLSKNKGFSFAVELVFDTASTLLKSNEDLSKFLEKFNSSISYIKENPLPKWVVQNPSFSNEQFVDKLMNELDNYQAAQRQGIKIESFDIKSWYRSLKESLGRLANTPNDALATVAVGLSREYAHTKASRFLGDVFVYLNKRGTADNPGEILKDVIAKLREAQLAKKPGDDKLIVIGHSLGGVIVYDVLTHFAKDIHIDTLLTVGSQVALFEEMSLYRTVSKDPVDPIKDRIEKPVNVTNWLNVYDTNDIFSFRAKAVFNGVTDYRFNTGYGLLDAHGGYFVRPSFYKRLAIRINEMSK